MRLSLGRAAAWLGIDAYRDSKVIITGVRADSRDVSKGDLFVCIPGERVDGHDFANKAVEHGAAAILAERPLPNLPVPVLQVEDTIIAMGELARNYRKETNARVICITGTAGKTTLKDTLYSILRQAGCACFSRGNHNNQIGLPYTILNSSLSADFWLLEIGISHAGDMEYLANIARPDLAIILNVGPGHVEGLGDKGVAWHKARILKFLSGDGIGLINADYPELEKECRLTGAPCRIFGSKSDEFRLMGVQDNGIYECCLEEKKYNFKTPFLGAYGGETALAAAAAAYLAGIKAEFIAKGLESATEPAGRCGKFELAGNFIFDSTYNANPLSMRAVLLAARDEARRRGAPLVAALGEMGELGRDAAQNHLLLGRLLAEIEPDAVFWKGNYGPQIKEGMGDGAQANNFHEIAGLENFIAQAEALLAKGSFVWVFKGSRSNHMEEYLSAFTGLLEKHGAAHVL